MKIDSNILSDERMVTSFKVEKYEYILNHVHKVDVLTNNDFQTRFNGFYNIRRGEPWRDYYYQLFEEAKQKPMSFAKIITCLYNYSGNVEISFSSKMYSTLNTDKPIWDKHVIHNLGYKLTCKGKEKLKEAIKIYKDMENWYNSYLDTDEAVGYIKEFDKTLPKYSWISNTKKIDYLLWGTDKKLQTNK